MAEANRLREMAEWWRGFAEVAGAPEIRQSRIDWAAYLDKLAVKAAAAPRDKPDQRP
jgi:hypothetical protein